MRVRLFPVRHHSPSAARCIAELFRRDPPRAVVIEGPADAGGLIPILAHPDTVPPVSILAYVPGVDDLTELYPYVSYSPEYAALVHATRAHIPVSFCDVPAGVSLAHNRILRASTTAEAEAPAANSGPPDAEAPPGYWEALPDLLGYESFDEFWESAFEMPPHSVDAYVGIALEFGRLVRSRVAEDLGDPAHWDRIREAHMRERVRAVVRSGVPEDEILVVCGAFHAAAFADDDFLEGGASPPPAEVALTVIPYSYPRMSQQIGYGAGNRAPLFYQTVHDRRGDFRRTALEALIGLAEQLRLRGHAASLADVIDAYRLSNLLARMRGKTGPGLEEIRDACIASMLQGRSAVLDDLWGSQIVGTSVGRVASIVGKTSLQEEFWREVGARRIPATDEPVDFWLHLSTGTELGTSVFLHRLRVADIPFARLASQGDGSALLSQVREKWTTQWTPATEAALVERIVLGQTVVQVCESKLRHAAAEAAGVGPASEVLLEIAVCDLRHLYDAALLRVEHASATGDDLYDLAVACQNLGALLSYGTSRALERTQIHDLLLRLLHRAAGAIPRIGRTDADGAERACTALKILHDVTQAHARDDRMYFDALEWAAGSSGLHPQAAGLAASLLYAAQRIDDDGLAVLVRPRVSGVVDPSDGASYFAGLLSINRSALVKNRAVVGFLDGLIRSVPMEAFANLIPIFRRSLGELSRAEMSYLLEIVFAIHGISDPGAAAGVVSERDLATLRDADGDVRDLTSKWDDLFGGP